MMITAEERLMYQVMKAIYDSGIPISFKPIANCCVHLWTGSGREIAEKDSLPPNWIPGMFFQGMPGFAQ